MTNTKASPNVFLCKALKCSGALATGIWNNGTLSPYLFMLSRRGHSHGSTTEVGLVQGLFGLATAILAFPVGFMSDKVGRHVVARLSSMMDAVTVVLMTCGVLASHHQFQLIAAAAVFCGFSSACDPNIDALFADSIPAAQRSAQFTQLQALSMVCYGIGPVIATIVFHIQGDVWTIPSLAVVILLGMMTQLIPICIKLLVHDKHTLGVEAEALTVQHGNIIRAVAGGAERKKSRAVLETGDSCSSANSSIKAQQDILCTASAQPGLRASLEQGSKRTDAADNDKHTQGVGSIQHQEDTQESRLHMLEQQRTVQNTCCLLDPKWVPFLLYAGDLVTLMASGMTIKFFPIFFMEKAGLSPIENSMIAAAAPFAVAGSMVLAKWHARHSGRIPCILLFRWVGVTLMMILAASGAYWRVKFFLVPLVVVRNAVMNGTAPLSRSILMDFVEQKHRGRWSCLDGMGVFGWSGSALLGGYLLDRHGFSVVFYITATVHLVSSLFYVALLPVVASYDALLKSSDAGEGGAQQDVPAPSESEEPVSGTNQRDDDPESVCEPLLPTD